MFGRSNNFTRTPRSVPLSDEQPTFEQALEQLEAVVHDLEAGELGLEDALARYEQGVRLLKQCQQQLSRAERRIELLTGVDAAGNPGLEPLADEDPDSRPREPGRQSRSQPAAASEPPEPRRASTRNESAGPSAVDDAPRLF